MQLIATLWYIKKLNQLKKVILVFLTLFTYGICSAQTEIKAPFNIKVKIKKNSNDSIKNVEIKLTNLSFKTYYLSNYLPTNSTYSADSICGFSLNYTNNYSDPLISPNAIVDFIVWKPFQTVRIQKSKVSDSIKTVYVDFDYINRQILNEKNKKIVSKNKKKNRIEMTYQEFFNNVWLSNDAFIFLDYKIKVK